jgi:hypothetical protein
MLLLQVCDGRKLRDTPGVSGQDTSLVSQGVSDGATLVLFKRRTPPSTDGGQITHPSLEQIERVVRAEAERQGREVVTPAQPSEANRAIAPLESRLHDIMQVRLLSVVEGLSPLVYDQVEPSRSRVHKVSLPHMQSVPLLA